MPGVKEYISRPELRERLGISKPAEKKAIDTGRLKLELYKGKWMYEWHSNRTRFIGSSRDPFRYTPDKVAKRKPLTLKRKIKLKATMGNEDDRGNHPIDLIEDPPDKDGDFIPGMNKVKAEAVKQLYLAKSAKLSFLKEAGLLVEMAQIKKEGEEIATRVQKVILAIPDRVAELYASMTDAKEIHQNLTDELIHALTNLRDIEEIAKKREKNDYFEEEVEEQS